MMLALSVPVEAHEKRIPPSEIPAPIHNYIKAHFANQSIIKAEVEQSFLSKKYKIKLNSLTKLTFNGKLEIIKLDSKSALPESVLPPELYAYAKANYPNNAITEWKLKSGYQEIELDNGLEIEFTLTGEFLRIDT